jgi:hypothetical protein
MHAQRGESAFRSSEQISFSSRPFYSDALPDTDSALPVTCSSLQFDFMVLPNLCVFRDGGFRDGGAIAAVAAFSRGRRKNKRKKKSAAGKNPRRGLVADRRKRGSRSTRPACENLFTKRCGCRCALRLWNPEIIDRSHLTSPVEGSKTGRHSACRSHRNQCEATSDLKPAPVAGEALEVLQPTRAVRGHLARPLAHSGVRSCVPRQATESPPRPKPNRRAIPPGEFPAPAAT